MKGKWKKEKGKGKERETKVNKFAHKKMWGGTGREMRAKKKRTETRRRVIQTAQRERGGGGEGRKVESN